MTSPKLKGAKRLGSLPVGQGISAANSQWTFGGDVAENFSEHVRRSVPLYDEGHDLICRISDYFVKDNSVIYELGVSTGNLILKLAHRHDRKSGVRFVGIDREERMVEKARKHAATDSSIEIEVGDICLWEYEPSDLIVSYYTIQFIYPRIRQDLVNKLYKSLNWGGALLLFEKVRAPDARFQDISTAIFTDFKLENGFSADEVVSKGRSLKGVLEPFSVQGNVDLLSRAGFVDVMTVMTYTPFAGFLAIK